VAVGNGIWSDKNILWNEYLLHSGLKLQVFAAEVKIRVVSWRMALCYNPENYNLYFPNHYQTRGVLDVVTLNIFCC
jgi:hypothetical protein